MNEPVIYIMSFVIVLVATALFYAATAIWERRNKR